MASLTLRLTKGEPLTNAEVDANFSNLNADAASRLLASSNLSDLANAGTARTNLGLGNVENKSSATIRSELTSLNVTGALGFTPLSDAGGTVSGALTLGAGTANGVAYLNGSKVLTSGSALTFDGTNLGVGVVVPYGGMYGTIHAYSATGAILRLDRTGAGTSTIQSIETGTAYRDLTLDAANNIFSISGSEVGRFTSTGLGIGTSSPSEKLTVAGNGAFSGAQPYISLTDSVWTTAATIRSGVNTIGTATGDYLMLNVPSGKGISFSQNNATALATLDSSGNLGLGTSSPTGRLTVYGGETHWGQSSSLGFLGTAGGGTPAIGSLGALPFAFFTNFTERARILSGGQFLIGSTAAAASLPSGALQVGSGFSGITNTGSLIAPTILTSGSLEFNFDGVSGSQRHGRITGTSGNGAGGPYGGGLAFEHYSYDGVSTYRWYTGLSLDGAGNVGIGTSSPAKKLQLDGGNAYTAAMRFSYGSSAPNYYADWGYKSDGNKVYLTITDGGSARDVLVADYTGNVGIGTSSPANRLTINGGAFSVTRGSNGTSASFVSGDGTNDTTLAIGHSASGITLTNSNPYTGAYNNLIFANTTVGETMRIGPNGYLGIGTSSPGFRVDVRGSTGTLLNVSDNTQNITLGTAAGNVGFVNGASGVLGLYSSGSERARIDSSGRMQLGTTTMSDVNGSRLTVAATFPMTPIEVRSDSTSGHYSAVFYNPFGLIGQLQTNGNDFVVGGAGVNQNVLFTQGNGTERARITISGGFSVGTTVDPGLGAIYATGNITAYYSSDAKFKENVTDIPDAAATVVAIGGKLFDWTDEYIASHGGEDGYFVQKQDFGVIAQDVQKVFPRAVREREDGSLAVDYEKLSALAFAAIAEQDARIKEQQARNDDQEVRIARLERLIEVRLQ